jgi:hypothetical protein
VSDGPETSDSQRERDGLIFDLLEGTGASLAWLDERSTESLRAFAAALKLPEGVKAP